MGLVLDCLSDQRASAEVSLIEIQVRTAFGFSLVRYLPYLIFLCLEASSHP